jgi:protein TonB
VSQRSLAVLYQRASFGLGISLSFNIHASEAAFVPGHICLGNHLLICVTPRHRCEGVPVTRNTTSPIEANEPIEKRTKTVIQSVTMRPVAPPANDIALFEGSLLDSSPAERKKRTWTTIFSFALQLSLIGLLILPPLWFTDVLPKPQLVSFLEAPPPPPPPPPAPAASTPARARVVKVTSNIVNGQLRTPSRVPARVQMIKEDDTPPPVLATGGLVGGVPGGIPGGQLNGVIGGIVSSSLPPAPPLPKPAPTVQRVRVSPGVITGLLVHRVEPTYPPVAQQAHIQGSVVLTAIIDKNGNVQQLRLVSGPPLLVPAAIEAVKQWHYKPFLLNGEPLEVETTVTINFHLRSE